MDVLPGAEPNGKTVVLMHGKAFGGYYYSFQVYLLAVMERAPHFHLWFVPKKDGGGLRGVDYLAQRPPLTASFIEAEAMSIKIREQFEQS
jgi:hypothetical protein